MLDTRRLMIGTDSPCSVIGAFQVTVWPTTSAASPADPATSSPISVSGSVIVPSAFPRTATRQACTVVPLVFTPSDPIERISSRPSATIVAPA